MTRMLEADPISERGIVERSISRPFEIKGDWLVEERP